jgi:hypothetical protein
MCEIALKLVLETPGAPADTGLPLSPGAWVVSLKPVDEADCENTTCEKDKTVIPMIKTRTTFTIGHPVCRITRKTDYAYIYIETT